jgi:hypothetical protein
MPEVRDQGCADESGYIADSIAHIRGVDWWTHRGTPGRRDWYANVVAHPEFTFHLKQTANANLPAKATPILDTAKRRAILASILQTLGGSRDLDAWVAGSPLVVVEFLDA